MLFPADEDVPRLVAVHCTVKREIPGDDETIMYKPDLAMFLGGGCYDYQLIDRIGHSGRKLRQPIYHVIRDNFLNDGSPPNRCVRRLMRGKAPHAWAGNLLAMKVAGTGTFEKWVDMSMDDLPTVQAFYEWYPDEDGTCDSSVILEVR
ncbi:hypothetical protein GLOTRDRAFT_110303 [Gloeophyllum trabeum ATCC 11539]|uniref:Uncharacterized protein n=1 Tax=Gloeophyllum trabeum (strain ATCC 11539 / FP-39264 / Madison 617) TaxID=670483 RepID=S7QFP3_GLOTA|nr:uncharacterized protein GLOTRDRAFT_110303 [Gloeophyllum trabeum ATCC 11539]EPQ58676.1 hypothetical protein GLOTRDRAFT_110303 [Gloeophyllum trabeum ATCC 11539]